MTEQLNLTEYGPVKTFSDWEKFQRGTPDIFARQRERLVPVRPINTPKRTESYQRLVEEMAGSKILFSGFENDSDYAGVESWVNRVFSKPLLDKTLVSEIKYFPDIVRVRVGQEKFNVPVTVYLKLVDTVNPAELQKYRAISFPRLNSERYETFSSTPIFIFSFVTEKPSQLEYLQTVPNQDKMRFYKFGLIVHELSHSIYYTLLSKELQSTWGELVPTEPYITDYASTYKDNPLLVEESFVEAMRLYTTVPVFLRQNFPKIFEFLQLNFSEITPIPPDPLIKPSSEN